MKQEPRLVVGFNVACPVIADEQSLEEQYQRIIKPLIQVMYQYPKVPLALYISGFILKFLEKRYVASFDVLFEMVKRKRLEILGGGMYEPNVSFIPRGDAYDQFEFMTTYIRQHFGKRPRGFWLPGDIWHTPLVSLLKRSGLTYTVIEKDILARCSPVHYHKPGSIYITEYERETMFILPRNTVLEQYMFREEAAAFMQRLLAISHSGKAPIVLFPQVTSCMEDSSAAAWLAEFLHFLSNGEYDLNSMLPMHLLNTVNAFNSVYIPDFGLEKLTPHVQKQELGHDSRLALTRIPENMLLYIRMQYVHSLWMNLRNDKSRKKTAQETSWLAQSIFAYSSTQEGGIQINAHRKKHYAALIEAERTIRGAGNFSPTITSMDYDFDGMDETLYSGYDMNVYIHHRGASIFELDWIRSRWNYLDTFYRCRENSADNPPEQIPYDYYYRRSFVDHFLDTTETLQRFMQGKYQELGSFVHTLYTCTRIVKDKKKACFTSEGRIQQQGKIILARMEKNYSFSRNTVRVSYTIVPQQRLDDVFFIPEINFSFSSCNAEALELRNETGALLPAGRGRRIRQSEAVSFIDLKQNLAIQCTFPGSEFVWSFPVYSWGMHHKKSGEMYQFSCLLPIWRISVKPGEDFHCEIVFKIEKALNAR